MELEPTMSVLKTILTRFPVSLAVLVIMWALHLVDFPTSHWLALTTAHPGGAIILSVLIVLWLVPAEWRLGSLRTLAVGVVSQLISVPLSIVLARGIETVGLNRWGNDLLSDTFLTPIGFIAGAAGFASALLPRLWRRRLRVSLIVLTATFVLYSGTMSDVLGIVAAMLSITAGQLLFKPESAPPSIRERRVLLAVGIACVAIGPAFVALDPMAEGPFSQITQLLWAPHLSALEATQVCADSLTSTSCTAAVDLARAQGIGALVANIMPFIIQLVVCFGLMRGRVLAWWMAVITQVLAIALLTYQLWDDSRLSYLLPNLVLVILPWLLALFMLLINYSLFRIRENRAFFSRTIVFAILASSLGAGLWILTASLHNTVPPANLADILAETPLRFVPAVVALILPHHVAPATMFSWFIYLWVGNAFWILLAVRLYLGFSRPVDPAQESDRDSARRLLESGTGDHLSFMTLWKSNRYFFHGDSYVAYRVSNGIALTLGAPVGRDISAEFERFASEQGWAVAWYSVNAQFADAHPQLKRLQVAEEAVLNCESVEFKGKKFQNVRTARNKAEKEGVSTRWTTWEELDIASIARISALSEDWVSDKALPEMGFTLGGLEEMTVTGTRLLLAESADGTLHGVTSWMPVYENGAITGYVLDVMRRNEHGFKGVIELLISEAMLIAQSEGLAWISLSGAPLAGQPDEPNWLDVALNRIGEEVEPLYGFRTLAASKRKFQPEEHPWYLCYHDELKLPSIALATMHAYLPDMKTKDAVSAVKAWMAA
ncbi:bifunctional lysylphosphatidylglycerol flippase/synthetase MprF [Corynebacterium kefirresidentii]|uniref:bifunctional lysylphosphatidylglycerol flippase/synthetase MprF n=2 Tax=Corynebacterium kefirresidentii TaxID=1979527 RepID=UPI0038CF7E69